MSDVHANGRSIVHKGDGLTQTAGPPDVCKTPSPGGPVPIPYPNAAMDRDLARGTKSVTIAGNAVAHAGSNLKTSTGDEAGTAGGGIISCKTKGKLTFGSSSIDVKVEGKGVVRFMDVTQHNGNTFNTVLAAGGEVFYGDDPMGREDCVICGEAKSKHKLAVRDDVLQKAMALRKRLQDPNGAFARAFVKSPGSKTPLKKGVMIGVLACQCDARKQYAGLAGPRYDTDQFKLVGEAFEKEASEVGLVPVVATPLPPPLTGFGPLSGGGRFGRIAGEQWDTTLAEVKLANGSRENKTDKREDIRGNVPLTCAAPKVIQKCLAAGHKPGTLAEMWVATTANSKVIIPRIFGLVADLSTVPPTVSACWRENLEFRDGDTVPSCVTCQVVCTGMICNVGLPPCP